MRRKALEAGKADSFGIGGSIGLVLKRKMRKRVACALFDSGGDYFFAGVVWVVLVPERTEWSALERERRMVRPMELSMKMMAE
jgi:hypothetical protein